jgi:UDP-glucose 4-epimerase
MDNLKQGMVSIYLRYIHDGVEVPVTGPLTRYRDFVFVRDVLDALELALHDPATDGGTFNVGTGRKTTVRELIDIIAAQYGYAAGTYPVRNVGTHPGDVSGSVASITKIASLGWRPRFDVEAGVAEMVAWLKGGGGST